MIEELTDNNYSNIIENYDGLIFIDFYSPACTPCHTFSFIFSELEKKFRNEKIKFLKCDISKNLKINNKYKIKSIPFTILINEKKEIKEPKIGIQNNDYYFNMLIRYLNNAKIKKINFFTKLKSLFDFF